MPQSLQPLSHGCWRWGLRIRRGSLRISQEGPWLHTGWKSNMSQSEVRAELSRYGESADTEGVPGRLEKEWSTSLVFAWGLGVLADDCGLVHVFSWTSKNWSNKDECSGVLHSYLCPGASGLGIKVFRISGLGEHL